MKSVYFFSGGTTFFSSMTSHFNGHGQGMKAGRKRRKVLLSLFTIFLSLSHEKLLNVKIFQNEIVALSLYSLSLSLSLILNFTVDCFSPTSRHKTFDARSDNTPLTRSTLQSYQLNSQNTTMSSLSTNPRKKLDRRHSKRHDEHNASMVVSTFFLLILPQRPVPNLTVVPTYT